MTGWAIIGRREALELGGCRESGRLEPSSFRRVEAGAVVVVTVSDGARLGLRDPNRCWDCGASGRSSVGGGVGDLTAEGPGFDALADSIQRQLRSANNHSFRALRFRKQWLFP